MVAEADADRRARLDALTGLRFWFAFLVVLHHSLVHWFGPVLYPLADFGYIGVDFFFVLSGFVLSWSHRASTSSGRFYWNRFARIWPLHLTTLVIAVVFVVDDVYRPGVLGTIANLLLVQAWSPKVSTFFGYNAVAWSLSVEVFFYLCFPWLLRRLTRMSTRSRRRLLVAIVGLLVLYPGVFSLTVAPHDPAGWEWSTYVAPLWRLGEFVVGVLTALAVRDGWRPPLRGRGALTVAAALSACVVGWGFLHGGLPDRPFVELAGMLVVATVIAAVASDELAGRRRSLLASRPMVRLGAASYALYLVHALWLAWFVRHGPPVGTGMTRLAAWAAYAVGAVGLAFVLHHVVEVPCERRLRKLSPLAIPTAKRAPRQRRPQLREVASS